MQLTKAQREQAPKYREKWLKIGLCTDPADFDEAEKIIPECYKVAGLKPPKRFLRAASPIDAIDRLGDTYSAMIYGCFDGSWLARYDFCLNVLGKKECEKLGPLMELAKCIGWWSPYEHEAIMQDRPKTLHRDEQFRLHNPNGMAISYRDGWGCYFYHGISVAPKLIEERDRITPEMVDKEHNQEIKRIMVELMGPEKYMEGSKPIHQDEWGKLYERLGMRMVEVVNKSPEPDGSFKHYWLRVPPNTKTAKDAVAWTFFKNESEYQPQIET